MAVRTEQPLFHRTYREIVERIERGDHGPGERLPSERWFAEHLGVSRTTVRRAFDELVADGVVVASGRGVQVPPRPAGGGDRLVSLTELASARGLTVSARVRRAEVRAATLDEADLFAIAPGSEVFDLERVRLLDGLEVSIDQDRVPLALLPNALELDFTSASLYAAIEAGGVVLAEARTQIEAAAATTDEAWNLQLDPGAPVLVSTERTVDPDGRVVTIGRTAFRSDRHRFLATFVRRPSPRATDLDGATW